MFDLMNMLDGVKTLILVVIAFVVLAVLLGCLLYTSF